MSFTHLRSRTWAPILFLAASLGFLPASRATIYYSVSLDHPEQHLFQVSMTIPDVSESVTVQMPAWNALYQIRDFASHVQQVQALTGDQPVPVEKMDKQTWRITGSGTITVRYSTFWDEPGPFSTQLNAEHAFINPAMILLYVPDRRGEKVDLSVSFESANWRAVGPTLESYSQLSRAQSVRFGGSSYDALADGPIEIGPVQEFAVPGISPKISVVVHGDNWKRERFGDVLRRICEYEIKLMGGAPFDHYLFIFHIGKAAAGAGGGMEHANSTAISVSSDEYLPNVAAHEFFHLWNVKRIRPASLEPVDYTREQYTRALWFAEGVTSTYGSYSLVRSGLWTKQQFYVDLSEQITELALRPTSLWQSAEQSSLDAWLEKYPLYDRPESSVSYYTKGQVLGILLDILIRDRTDNTMSLDDVLRSMNLEFAQKGTFYRDSLDVRLTAEHVASSSFEEFFRRYVSGAEPLPYASVLPLAGLELRSATRNRATLGFGVEQGPGSEWRITDLDPEGPAAHSGLQAGDVIVRWNNADPPRRPERWLRDQKAGEKLRLRVQRENHEHDFELKLGEQTETTWQIVEAAGASEKARRIRDGLLRGVTQAEAAR